MLFLRPLFGGNFANGVMHHRIARTVQAQDGLLIQQLDVDIDALKKEVLLDILDCIPRCSFSAFLIKIHLCLIAGLNIRQQ